MVGGELGRMVSKKKVTKKDAGTAEKIVMPIALEDSEIQDGDVTLPLLDEESTDEVPEKASTAKTETTEQPVEEPKVAFVDETTKLLNLLGEAPPVPLILSIEDAVKFVDRYRVWKLKVKAETG